MPQKAAVRCFVESAPAKQASEGKYPLEAILALSPAQCSEESKKGNWVIGKEKYRMGELLCPAAESAVQQVFEKHTRVESLPEKGNTPSKGNLTAPFVEFENTRTGNGFGKRKIVPAVEWKANEKSFPPAHAAE